MSQQSGRKLIFLIGAGASVPAGMPTTKQTLKQYFLRQMSYAARAANTCSWVAYVLVRQPLTGGNAYDWRSSSIEVCGSRP